MHMETGFENVPEIIFCRGFNIGSWPNISGAKFTSREGGYNGLYTYTFNNLWNKKVTFRLEIYGREFVFLESFTLS
jgi:hypothetical protein